MLRHADFEMAYSFGIISDIAVTTREFINKSRVWDAVIANIVIKKYICFLKNIPDI